MQIYYHSQCECVYPGKIPLKAIYVGFSCFLSGRLFTVL